MIKVGILFLVATLGFIYWGYLLRVRQLLKERHPAIWQVQMAKRRWLTEFDAAQAYVWGRDLRLSDEELHRNIRGTKLLFLVGLPSWVAFVLAVWNGLI